MTTKEKIEALNNSGINDIHEFVNIKDGKITIQLQVGHPGKEGSIDGCFPTHAVEALIELHKHYNKIIPSRETSIVITKLQEARLWQEMRKIDRSSRGVLQTDKK